MCMRGLEDGIRVLTTYGLAFLSSLPAVSTATMGSLLQRGKLMNILGVKCSYSFKYSVPASGLICIILHIHWSIFINLLVKWCFLQGSDLFAYIQEQFGTSFQTGSYHPPRFLPCWHDKRGQSLIPELCYEGDSGVNDWPKSPRGKKCLSSLQWRCRQKAQSGLVKKRQRGCIVWMKNYLFIIILWMCCNSALSQLPDSFIQRTDP